MQSDKRQSIKALLRQADGQWNDGHLIEPARDDAFETCSEFLDLYPEHTGAKRRLVQIGRISAAGNLFLSAEGLSRQGKIAADWRMIATGLKMNPDDDRFLGLEKALDFEK